MDVPVKVHIRIKPDDTQADDGILYKLSSTKLQFNQEKEFEFDHIYDSSSDQEQIFDKCAVPLLEQLVAGFNVTIMAYGPTGSGKSYTLGTNNTQVGTPNEGLLARIIKWIFSRTAEDGQNQIMNVKVSFMEVYKEELFDVLPVSETKEKIKNDKIESVVMGNTIGVEVTNEVEALKVIENGNFKRQVKKTKANDSSSRSHAIITVTLTMLKDHGETRFSRIRIVDLAGSEAVAKDGTLGETKDEGIKINTGLLTLGKVINALNSKCATHIPHRESVLTRALKDSLSGNSLTVMICCIKSDFPSIAATSTALQFAANARALKTKVLPSTFKTPFKAPPTPFQSGQSVFKTPYRTPLIQVQQSSNKKAVVTPGGSTFAFPSNKRAVLNMSKQFEDLDESVLVSSSYDVAQKARTVSHRQTETEQDIENRIQVAVMGRVDAFLEEFREKLNQTLLFSSNPQSILESTMEGIRKKTARAVDPAGVNETLSLTMLADSSASVDCRRRSVRLAEKRAVTMSNSVLDQSSLNSSKRTRAVGAKRAAVLPLPTPAGKTGEHLVQYKKDMLHYLNSASQSQMQKLPSVGPKAAHCIISYRTMESGFPDLESLKLVPGLRKNFYDNFLKVNFLA